MTLSDAGRVFIEQQEGCRLQAYICPAGKLTIGYGHTGPDVHEGQTITQAQADDLFQHDIERFSHAVGQICPIAEQPQFDAMTSLAYNIGANNFAGSTLVKLHNAAQYKAAQGQFPEWDHINHVVNEGLHARRIREAALYGSA